jgi:hypothetical protein
MKKTLFAAALGLLALGAVALSQGITIPFVSNTHQSTDGIQIIPNGTAPQAGNVYATPGQITNVYGYYKSVPTNVLTYTFGANVTYAMFAPAGTLATAAITLAANPSDGARNCFFTTQILSSTTVSANTGQTVNNGLSAASVAANTGVCYVYSASNSTWDRS